MPKDAAQVALRALDTLAVALVDSGHVWTREERATYESGVSALLSIIR